MASRSFVAATLLASLALAACGSGPVYLGDKAIQARLKLFQPIPGKVSLYVCREQDYRPVYHPTGNVLVDGRSVGILGLNTFLQVPIEPGEHLVEVDFNVPTPSRKIRISGEAGSIVYLWIGQPGRGWSPLTIDFFHNDEQARECVSGAALAVPKP